MEPRPTLETKAPFHGRLPLPTIWPQPPVATTQPLLPCISDDRVL